MLWDEAEISQLAGDGGGEGAVKTRFSDEESGT